MEAVEAEVDRLGVSSLVVGLGGLATYPSFVTNEASLRFAIDTVAEEWLHQYLTFKPLGFSYFLDSVGIARNYEIVIMNEKELWWYIPSKTRPFQCPSFLEKYGSQRWRV